MARTAALIVSNDETTRTEEEKILRDDFGMKTKTVNNGKEAVKLFGAGKFYNLVLMDLQKPVEDVEKFVQDTRKLCKKDGQCCKIAGVVSANEGESEFISAGLDFYFKKPLLKENYIKIANNMPSD